MSPNFSQICRLVILALLIFIPQVTFAQLKEKIDFTYKVDSVQVAGQYQYNIHVKVIEGEGPFTVSIYENLKSDLKLLDKKDNVFDRTLMTLNERRICIIYVQNSSISAVKKLKYN